MDEARLAERCELYDGREVIRSVSLKDVLDVREDVAERIAAESMDCGRDIGGENKSSLPFGGDVDVSCEEVRKTNH